MCAYQNYQLYVKYLICPKKDSCLYLSLKAIQARVVYYYYYYYYYFSKKDPQVFRVTGVTGCHLFSWIWTTSWTPRCHLWASLRVSKDIVTIRASSMHRWSCRRFNSFLGGSSIFVILNVSVNTAPSEFISRSKDCSIPLGNRTNHRWRSVPKKRDVLYPHPSRYGSHPRRMSFFGQVSAKSRTYPLSVGACGNESDELAAWESGAVLKWDIYLKVFEHTHTLKLLF